MVSYDVIFWWLKQSFHGKKKKKTLNSFRSSLLLVVIADIKTFLGQIVVLTRWLTGLGIGRKMKVQKAKPHHYLKMIELGGFLGSAINWKLAEHLLKRAVSLEKLIIDPCVASMKYEEGCKNLEKMLAARARAKHLETSLPPKAELVIL